MKVLHLISGGDAGGARTHLLRLLPELAKTEDVTLLCLGDGPLARAAAELGLPMEILPHGFFAGLHAVKARAGEAHILHCHGSRANLTGALIKPALSCPVISTIHSDHTLDYLGRTVARLTYGALNHWALHRMDALLCVSEAMKNLYATRGFAPHRLYTIYNGADFSRPTPSVHRQSWFADLGIPVAESDVVLGAAARFDPVKDLPTLLRGFARAAEACPRLKLVLAGKGREEEALKALARQLGLENRVFFPGWLTDTESFYAAMDAAVLSSRSETFPYALTDAARYKKTAVATAVGGIPELVEDGVNGFLFPAGDEMALAQALERLCDDALRQRLGQALWEKTRRDFSLSATAEQQRQVYLAVVNV